MVMEVLLPDFVETWKSSFKVFSMEALVTLAMARLRRLLLSVAVSRLRYLKHHDEKGAVSGGDMMRMDTGTGLMIGQRWN